MPTLTDQNWPVLTPMDQYSTILVSIDTYWLVLTPMDQYWPTRYSDSFGPILAILIPMDPIGSIMIPMDQYWPILIHMDQYWREQFHSRGFIKVLSNSATLPRVFTLVGAQKSLQNVI